ncbi:MAG: hypothetical protein K8S18_13760, partial [Desulfobacula sp.]|nr:hypothetical protein [Desulfobacula sp.]
EGKNIKLSAICAWEFDDNNKVKEIRTVYDRFSTLEQAATGVGKFLVNLLNDLGKRKFFNLTGFSSAGWCQGLNFFILYFSANLIRSSFGSDMIYFFQPGHHPVCHLHSRPKNDLGLLSYFVRKPQLTQLCPAIYFSPLY